MEFSTSLIKLIISFLSQRKFSVSVEGEMSTPRKIRAGVPQGSVFFPTLYNMYINDAPQTPLYATDRKEGFFYKKTPAWSQLDGDLV
jgi:hypothetical protein